jgi:hypothetical protein
MRRRTPAPNTGMKRVTLFLLCILGPLVCARGQTGLGLSVSGYGSIQEALDHNPGRLLYVPAGDYAIHDAIRITTAGSGLWGYGRIVQENPDASILALSSAANVRISDLTLTRAPGRLDSTREAITADGCESLVIERVNIVDNRSQRPGIRVTGSPRCQVKGCTIENYMRLGVDDRTKSADWGFAFNVIDGTGMDIRDCVGALVAYNRIVEQAYRPTPEIKEKYHLGDFCKMNPTKGALVSQAMWEEKYYNAWHQGAALHIAAPETGDYIQIIGNYIANAAQGLDIQGDHVIVSQNIVNDAFIGMKAMHGARNVIIDANQFSKDDLWSIGLMPGAASHAAGRPGARTQKANVDGYHIVAHNIISDFGYGSAYWMWHDNRMSAYAIRLEKGQKPENPPLRDVLLLDNLLYDSGRDGILVDGKPVTQGPRFKYSVFITPGPLGPQGMHLNHNLWDPGTEGVINPPPAK